jgi:hypothetical protein
MRPPKRFPDGCTLTPWPYALESRGIDRTRRRLEDLFAFADATPGAMGVKAGRRPSSRSGRGKVQFDLELKRVPYRPEQVGDD